MKSSFLNVTNINSDVSRVREDEIEIDDTILVMLKLNLYTFTSLLHLSDLTEAKFLF